MPTFTHSAPRRALRLAALSAALGAGLLLACGARARSAPQGSRVERVVLLYRHGVRAPLGDEARLAQQLGAPLPSWPVAPEMLTPHGAQALTLLARYQRGVWQQMGLLPGHGCPGPKDIAIWANTAQRTIDSARALARGLAPGCDLKPGHAPLGEHDPVFEPMAAGAACVDGALAARDVRAYAGDPAAMAARYRAPLADMARIMGQGAPCPACRAVLSAPGTMGASADGHGLSLTGPIDLASSMAQVILLQYMEGMPMRQVGWGHADAAAIARISALHAALFDVFDRSPYMAPRSGGVLARRMLTALFAPGQPRITLLVGHDNNIAALASLLGTRFRVPGLAWNDPPPGGAIGLALEHDRGGHRRVRAFYIAATPDQVRHLTRLDAAHRPARISLSLASCPAGSCSAGHFQTMLSQRIEAAAPTP